MRVTIEGQRVIVETVETQTAMPFPLAPPLLSHWVGSIGENRFVCMNCGSQPLAALGGVCTVREKNIKEIESQRRIGL
jgi:hypothetical protein